MKFPTFFSISYGMAVIYLGLGDLAGGGMGWDLDVNWNHNFGGTFSFTQLINRDWSWDISVYHVYDYLGIPWSDSTGGNYWLDNSSPYKPGSIIDTTAFRNNRTSTTMAFGDAPSLTDNFYSFADLNDSFTTYLQFQPTGGIPVTIGSVTWGWVGQTAVSGGIWSLAKGTVSGPTQNLTDDSPAEWINVYINHN
jgi:hypothetical protein